MTEKAGFSDQQAIARNHSAHFHKAENMIAKITEKKPSYFSFCGR